MKTLRALIARNCKVYFRDKGVFFPSLIAPLILLFLFIAFLGNVYRDSIRGVVEGYEISNALVESIASGWLISSLLAVCTVTIAFTANIVMVQDKVQGQLDDMLVSPLKRSTLALSYFISSFLVTSVISLSALAAGYVYIAIVGWHLSAWDAVAAVLDTLILTLFGTAFSSVICSLVKSQGGVVAVQSTVSAAYGFLCGAYMPVSNLTGWLQQILMCLPGTYGTGLLHEHLMGGAIEGILGEGMPQEMVTGLKEGFDCTLDFFGHTVPEWACFAVLIGATVLIAGAYVLLCACRQKRKNRKNV